MQGHSFTPVATAIVALCLVLAPAAPAAARDCPDCDREGGRPDTLVAHPAASSVRWSGMKMPGGAASEGTVPLSRGELVLRHGELTGGSFTIDMKRLRMDGPDRAALRGQLAGSGALDVDRFPTAAFVATRAVRTGDSTWRVTGNLTLHGITRPVTFSSDVHWVEVGHMIATADIALDRRRFGIASAGSLADRMVDDTIQLRVRLDARRRGAVVAER